MYFPGDIVWIPDLLMIFRLNIQIHGLRQKHFMLQILNFLERIIIVISNAAKCKEHNTYLISL